MGLTLDVAGLTCSFGGRAVWEDLSLAAAAGESVAVTGPSGSGKSTLLSCLAGLLKPEAGSIRVCGTDPGALRPSKAAAWRLKTIGFVYQFGELLPELTAIENAALPLLIGGSTRAEAYGTAETLLADLKVGHVADSPAGTLSGGERQRIALARALATRPPVILADEPTGALDETTTAEVCDLLFSLPRRYGCTLLLVTHNPYVASQADHELHLTGGRLRPAAAGA
ncbi:ABC transporter ATP-binding protein [Streptomyces sp. NPDC020807]|uniref:ABC transporter ATP-binding protein n=1 Tax=Streptomyces sp. NPDC020807 TaxID=3155119 RepID=UPI0033F41D8F